MGERNSCVHCSKKIHKFEQVFACEKYWHKPCFKCGITGPFTNQSCHQVLNSDPALFVNHENNPYCSGCYIKILANPVTIGFKPHSDFLISRAVASAPLSPHGHIEAQRSLALEASSSASIEAQRSLTLEASSSASTSPSAPITEITYAVKDATAESLLQKSVVVNTTEIIYEINKIRTNPQSYIPYLKEYLETFVDDFVHTNLNGRLTRTINGKKEVEACIDLLGTIDVVPPLTSDVSLELASRDHVLDAQINGQLAHVGTDGSSQGTRVMRYAKWRKKVGENLCYNKGESRDIVISWIIDDADPTKHNRNNIFDPELLLAGSVIGGHPLHRTFCVITLANRLEPLSSAACNF